MERLIQVGRRLHSVRAELMGGGGSGGSGVRIGWVRGQRDPCTYQVRRLLREEKKNPSDSRKTSTMVPVQTLESCDLTSLTCAGNDIIHVRS